MRSVIYGMTIYFMESYDKELVYDALCKRGVTIASLVTVMLRDLLSLLHTVSFPEHVRCILLGGSSVPRPLLEEVKQKQIPLFQSYGMTETSSQIVTLQAEDALRKLGSSGKALFPAEVKIAHEDAKGIGEIYVTGPMVI